MDRIPMWVWITGGVGLVGAVFLLTRSSASAVDTTGQSSGLTDTLQGIMTALSNLQGQLPGSGTGSTTGGITGIPPGGPVPIPKPNPVKKPFDYAGKISPFGTRYPDYVHTLAQAIAWIKRALANGAKPIYNIPSYLSPTGRPIAGTSGKSQPTISATAPVTMGLRSSTFSVGTVHPQLLHPTAPLVSAIGVR